MPEAVATYAAEFAVEVLAADAAASAAWYAAAYIATTAAIAYSAQEMQRRAQAAQRDAYNASLRDRYTMLRGTTLPRTLVLGRQRVSGPPFFMGSYGVHKEHLAFCVPLAAHEIDAVEAIYFNDEQLVMDGAGNVLNILKREQFSLSAASDTFTIALEPKAGTLVAVVDYGTSQVTLTTSLSGLDVTVSGGSAGVAGTLTISYQPAVSQFGNNAQADEVATFTLDGSGNGSTTLPSTYLPGTARATHIASGDSVDLVDPWVSMAGNVLTVTGYPLPSITVTVNYQVQVGNAYLCRIKTHLGAPGQVADADLIASLPEVWTSAHTASGVAYLKIECDYDTTAFPSGLPNVSATVRGAKVLDPRTGATAWSENPALLMRHAALSPLCGRLDSTLVNDTATITAANVADVAASYVVNGITYPRPLYTAGLVHRSGTRPQDTLNDLAQAMGGRWVFTDGQLRMKAGAWQTPLQTLNESWLSDAGPVHVQPTPTRQDVFNAATGSFCDERRDYRVLPFPRVESAAYIAADGADLPQDIPLNAVTFTGQAQQVVAAAMRDARQGLRLSLTCNMRAFAVEVFDVINVSLARFGWVSKPFEVLDATWSIDGGITLQLKETDPSIWALGTAFEDADPAPNTRLPSPSTVPAVAGLAAASGTAHLIKQPDGTILSRMLVSWAPLTDSQVLGGGGVEVRYGSAGTAEAGWESLFVSADQAQTYIKGLRDGAIYSVKARAYNAITRGAWSLPIVHKLVGKTAPPANVASLAATLVEGAVRLSWAPCTDVDYASTVLYVGATFGSAVLLADVGPASVFNWISPAIGTYTVWAVHVDTTGNVSATPASVSAVVTAAINSALVAAGAAAADAAAALTAIGNMGADNILSPVEKPDAVARYSVITTEQAGIDASATAFGSAVATEKTAYDTAVGALTTYLGTLSGWNTIPGTDVAIVGTTFRSKFADVYAARQTLMNKMAQSVGTGQIVPAAVSETITATPADSSFTQANFTAPAILSTADFGTVTYTNSSAAAQSCVLSFSVTAKATGGGGPAGAYPALHASLVKNTSTLVFNKFVQTIPTAEQAISGSYAVTVAAGDSISFSVYGIYDTVTTGTAIGGVITWRVASAVAVVTKR